jgi:hypothetical protein
MSKGSAIVGFILSFICGMALMYGVDRGAGQSTGITADASTPGAWSDAAASVPVTSKDPSWGSRTAMVTIVEYSDFQ